MQINFEQLRSLMKKSGIPVSRDSAPTGIDYPYIVYEFVNEQHKRASNKVLQDMPLYQIAVITNGTEKDYKPLKVVLTKQACLILNLMEWVMTKMTTLSRSL